VGDAVAGVAVVEDARGRARRALRRREVARHLAGALAGIRRRHALLGARAVRRACLHADLTGRARQVARRVVGDADRRTGTAVGAAVGTRLLGALVFAGRAAAAVAVGAGVDTRAELGVAVRVGREHARAARSLRAGV